MEDISKSDLKQEEQDFIIRDDKQNPDLDFSSEDENPDENVSLEEKENKDISSTTEEEQISSENKSDVIREYEHQDVINDEIIITDEYTDITGDKGEYGEVESEKDLNKNSRMEELLNSIKGSISRIEEKYDKKIANDEHKNSLFDKMYEELAGYKKDLYAKLLGPFINETLILIDDYIRIAERLETMDQEKLKKNLLNVPEDLETILENNGVERYTDASEKFNPKTQRAIRTVPTDQHELDNSISERVRQGYRWNGVMIKPELVKVYKYVNLK